MRHVRSSTLLVWFAPWSFAAASCGGATHGLPADAGSMHDASGSNVTADDGSGGSDSSTMTDGSPDGPPAGDGASDGSTIRQCPAPTADAGPLAAAPAPVCAALSPSSPTIATFDGALPVAFAAWGTAPLVGGTYVFPACKTAPPEPSDPLFEDYSANNWHITGMVGDYSGFGIWWVLQAGAAGGYPMYANGPLDASAYAGIQFDISGNPGPLGAITLLVMSTNQQILSTTAAAPNCGTCGSDAGRCNVTSTASVASLTSTPRTLQVRWSDLTTNGPLLDPSRLVEIVWSFPWISGGTPYPVDVTIDNVQFIPGASDSGTD